MVSSSPRSDSAHTEATTAFAPDAAWRSLPNEQREGFGQWTISRYRARERPGAATHRRSTGTNHTRCNTFREEWHLVEDQNAVVCGTWISRASVHPWAPASGRQANCLRRSADAHRPATAANADAERDRWVAPMARQHLPAHTRVLRVAD